MKKPLLTIRSGFFIIEQSLSSLVIFLYNKPNNVMANNKTTNQPGSNDMQPGRERSRNQQANDTGGQRPNGERTMTNSNKSKQEAEDNQELDGKSKQELADERGGHGHSGHSSNRSGSESNA